MAGESLVRVARQPGGVGSRWATCVYCPDRLRVADHHPGQPAVERKFQSRPQPRRCVGMIGKLTARNDLRYLTMIPWKSLFPSPLSMRGLAAWCPVCLTSWEQAGKAVYVPLLWTLDVVKFCPLHRHPLRLTCPHCGLPQPLLGQCSWVGFCTRCRRWLGSDLDSGQDDPERYSVFHRETPDWEVWVANQVADLIEAGFHGPPLLTREQLSQLVRIGTDLEGLSGFARILGLAPPRSVGGEWAPSCQYCRSTCV